MSIAHESERQLSVHQIERRDEETRHMCPNCFNTIAMALGGAGSAILAAAAGLRYLTQSNPEETES
jgi:uncharacterized membrane-anchored protein